jgi:hypothetical protein
MMHRTALHYVLLVCLFAHLFIDPARADFNCKEEDGSTVCDPESQTSYINDRMRQVRKLFESTNCAVSEMSSFGTTELIGLLPPTRVKIAIRYECQILEPSSSNPGRIKESGTEGYEFDCGTGLFKFYASGFDFFNDGKRMHWDSQGTSRPLPWRRITTRHHSPSGLASLLGFPWGGLARCHSLLNSKVFQLRASFQFLSQPDGLRSSSCPRVAGLVTVFDSDLSPPKRASAAPLLITTGFIAQP